MGVLLRVNGLIRVPGNVLVGALMTTLIALVGDPANRRQPRVTAGRLAAAGDIGSAVGPSLA